MELNEENHGENPREKRQRENPREKLQRENQNDLHDNTELLKGREEWSEKQQLVVSMYY